MMTASRVLSSNAPVLLVAPGVIEDGGGGDADGDADDGVVSQW